MEQQQREKLVDEPPCPEEDGAPQDALPSEAFADLGKRIGELKEYFSYYLTAKRDAFLLSIKKAGLYAMLGIVGMVAGAAIVATAGVLLVTSLGSAIGSAIGIAWLGNLIIALLVLLGVFLGLRAMIGGIISSSHRRTVEKYEQRQRKQSARFGRNVHESATAPRSEAAGQGE